MSGTTSSKFFWSDWRSDPGLRSCSLAARGLWMDLLAIAAEAQPTGYVLVNGRTLSTTDLARLTGAPEADVQTALAELDAAGVFSRDGRGRIYSRRMVRDAKIAKINRKNGLKGGNPSLCNHNGKSCPVNPPDKGADKAIAYSHSQIPKESPIASQPESRPPRAPAREAHVAGAGLAGLADLKISEDWVVEAANERESLGLPVLDLRKEADKLERFWTDHPPRNPHSAWLGRARMAKPDASNVIEPQAISDEEERRRIDEAAQYILGRLAAGVPWELAALPADAAA